MADKHKKEPQNINQQQSPAADNSQDVDKIAEDIEKMRIEAAQTLDGWRRAQADFINYKKRIDSERIELASYYKAEAVSAFLSVADDLKRALDNVPPEIAQSLWFKGFNMLQSSFEKALNQNKTEAFGQSGDEFDPNLHQAVLERNGETNKVIEVFAQGYRMGERILRHATVSVGNGQQ